MASRGPQIRFLFSLALGLVAGAPVASAHVAPSDRTNNRYVLIAPMGDRIRIAYTVFIGHQPGRRARARMDANRNGAIEPAEADRYAAELAARAASHIALDLDGAHLPLHWSEVEPGLGADTSTAGSAFAVDFVAWVCFSRPTSPVRHQLRLVDRFELPEPGEMELRAEESPGVTIVHSALGLVGDRVAQGRPRLDFKWMGGTGPLADSGYTLRFTVDPAIATFTGGPCPPAGAGGADDEARSGWEGRTIVALAVVGVVALLLLVARRHNPRDRRRRP